MKTKTSMRGSVARVMLPTMAYADSYDEVFYTGFAYRESRPDRLELVARLFGLEPTPAARARVLEIGCATGANILPMAEYFPGATFVGIDLSAPQVEAARATAAAAGLGNVELLAMDLCDVDERMGTFDYVIAHGIYSWVPAPVREKLLEMCARVLAPHGVAFISHNVKPGWHARALAREIMLYHTRGITDPREKVKQGRAALDFVLRGARPADQVYRATLAEQLQGVADRPEWALLHDNLSEVNEAWYFHEVCDRFAAHGLQYLADGDLSSMSGTGLPPETVARLDQFQLDVIQREQYLDLLKNRKFRQTLVCRAGLAIDRDPGAARLEALHVISPADAESADLDSETPVAFSTTNSRVRLSEPLAKRALAGLIARWPGSMPFGELAASSGIPRDGLATLLLRLMSWEIVELAVEPARGIPAAGDRPLASRLARVCAERGLPVANLRHEHANLDDTLARVLALLDGSRTRGELGSDATLETLARKALLLA